MAREVRVVVDVRAHKVKHKHVRVEQGRNQLEAEARALALDLAVPRELVLLLRSSIRDRRCVALRVAARQQADLPVEPALTAQRVAEQLTHALDRVSFGPRGRHGAPKQPSQLGTLDVLAAHRLDLADLHVAKVALPHAPPHVDRGDLEPSICLLGVGDVLGVELVDLAVVQVSLAAVGHHISVPPQLLHVPVRRHELGAVLVHIRTALATPAVPAQVGVVEAVTLALGLDVLVEPCQSVARAHGITGDAERLERVVAVQVEAERSRRRAVHVEKATQIVTALRTVERLLL